MSYKRGYFAMRKSLYCKLKQALLQRKTDAITK